MYPTWYRYHHSSWSIRRDPLLLSQPIGVGFIETGIKKRYNVSTGKHVYGYKFYAFYALDRKCQINQS